MSSSTSTMLNAVGRAIADAAWKEIKGAWEVYYQTCAYVLTEKGRVPHQAIGILGPDPIELCQLVAAEIEKMSLVIFPATHVMVVRAPLELCAPTEKQPLWEIHIRLCFISRDDAGCWPVEACHHDYSSLLRQAEPLKNAVDKVSA